MQPDPMSPEAAQQEINVIPLNFRSDFVPDRHNPGELKEVHKVDLVKKGTNGECTPWSIPALKKDMQLWPFVEPYYEYWLKGQEAPTEGIPLDVLPFLPPQIVKHLQNIHIRTAEDLARTTDSDLERIGMGARGWRAKAQAYLEAKADSRLAAEHADLKLANEQLQGEVEELKEQVAGLMADKPKRGPGRPKKVE